MRLAHPATRLEAITSRPLLLAGVARLTQHAGQSRLLLTLTHAAGDLIKSMVTNVRKGLDTILATAPQLTKHERWTALVRYIVEKIIDAKPKKLRSAYADAVKLPAAAPPGDGVTEEFRFNSAVADLPVNGERHPHCCRR